MDGSVFIELGLYRAGLPDLDHLSQLLITNESLINLQDGLLEDEEDRVLEYLLGI